MTELQSYITALGDVAKTNRFTLELAGPNLPTGFITNIADLKFFVTKATIPKMDITGPDVKFRGTSIKLAGDYKKEPLEIGLINDTAWNVRGFFEDWLKQIKNTVTNITDSNDNQRFGISAIVKSLDNAVETSAMTAYATYTFNNIMPMDISQIDLDMGQANAIQTFTVSFHYDTWERT